MRVFGNVSSPWDKLVVGFPQSHWTYYRYPFDEQKVLMRFKVNDAEVGACTSTDFHAHTRKELLRYQGGLSESVYLERLAPSGWTVSALGSWTYAAILFALSYHGTPVALHFPHGSSSSLHSNLAWLLLTQMTV